jgi:hypothetical protein
MTKIRTKQKDSLKGVITHKLGVLLTTRFCQLNTGEEFVHLRDIEGLYCGPKLGRPDLNKQLWKLVHESKMLEREKISGRTKTGKFKLSPAGRTAVDYIIEATRKIQELEDPRKDRQKSQGIGQAT